MMIPRAVLAVVLLAGMYLLAVAAALAAVVATAWPTVQWIDGQRGLPASTLTVLALGCVPVVFEIARAMIMANDRVAEPDSVPLPRDEHPPLWDLIDELAARLDAPRPTEVRLVAEGNAMVVEHSRWLGLAPGARLLYLGLPLLAELSVDELRAVLCHELAHYAGRHTRLSMITYRGHRSLDELRRNLSRAKRGRHFWWPTSWLVATAIQWIIAGYALLYNWLTYALRRRQEFEADACAVEVVGARTTREAVQRVRTLNAGWYRFDTRLLRPARQVGLVPTRPIVAFQRVLAGSDEPVELPRPIGLWQRPARYFDSHPDAVQRLRALGAAAANEADDDRPRVPAATLVADVGALLRAGGDGRSVLSVTQWLSRVGRWHAPVDRSEALLAATAELRGKPVVLDDVLDVLADRGADELAVALAGTTPRSDIGLAQAKRQLGECLAALVGDVLVAQGYAMWQPTLSGASVLLPPAMARTRNRTLVNRLAQLCVAATTDARGLHRLRQRLVAVGVDTHVRPKRAVRKQPVPDQTESTTAPRRRTARAMIGLAGGVVLAIFGIGPGAGTQIPPLTTFNSPPSTYFTYRPPPVVDTSLLNSAIERLLNEHSDQTITVQPGDTLGYLACRYLTTVGDLQTRNGLGTSTLIRSGQQLAVPFSVLERFDCHR